MTRYGLPYKGSKNKIAKRLIEFIPRTENFVDMMCGGASVSQCVKEHRPETNVHLNDVDEQLIEFLRLIDGNGWHGIEHFISHDEFFRLKDSRFDVSVCFSFGNDRSTYLYSYNKEFHVKYHEERLIAEGLPESYDRFLKEDKKKYRDVDVKCLRSVQRISSIFRFQERMHGKFASISCGTYFDYRFSDGMTPDNTVVYCDIPYRDTESRQYSERFHHERFYWWVRNSRYVCVTSEFSMPSDFVRVGEICRREVCKPTNGKRDMTVEGLFVHRDKVREYERMMGS